MALKAVIFDLDDTLYCELDYVDQAFETVAQYVAQYIADQAGDSEQTVKLLKNRIHNRMRMLLEQQGRGKIFNVICDEYAVDIPVKQLVEVYRSTKPFLHLYPDAELFLNYLEGKEISTGVITDGCSQVQNNKVEALKLRQRTDSVIVTDDYGISKPDQQVYLKCLDRLGINPEDACYVGDNPSKDFIGAKELGMKTFRIIRPEGDHMMDIAEPGYEADVTIHTMMELVDYI